MVRAPYLIHFRAKLVNMSDDSWTGSRNTTPPDYKKALKVLIFLHKNSIYVYYSDNNNNKKERSLS